MKLRGQRIELGEIEHALRAQPGVVEAVVVLDPRLDALVAYVSPAEAVGLPEGAAAPFGSVASLAGVRSSLPVYMVPSVVVGIDAWPRSSSGKIERRRLPAADVQPADASAIVGPRTPEETAARAAFAAVLGVAAEAISVEASFFELGGNSLQAVRLARELAAALGRSVRPADVVAHPTAAGLAAIAAGAGDEALLLPKLHRTVGAAQLLASAHPVSWSQSQLLTVHVVSGATAAYNIPTALWLDGSLSVAALRGALGAIVERHAVLRTTYEVDVEGRFAQRVRATPGGQELLEELTATDEAGAEALAAADASSGFELLGEAGGVLRCMLVRVEGGSARQLLQINVHHVASDGLSSGVLLGELGALYRALSSGGSVEDAALPALEVQYVDYAVWQRRSLTAALLEPSHAYWRTQLREGALPVL